jgi:thiamine transport system substrate-binding protein
MKSKWRRALLAGALGATAGAAASAHAEVPVLAIATYDSIVAKHGLGSEIFPLFEKKCGCRVQAAAAGDGAQLLSRLQLDAERGSHAIQVVMGLDQTVWARAKPYLEPWGTWRPRGYDKIQSDARVEPGFLPFDYGVLAFVADREALAAARLEAPARLAELLKPEWRRQVILEDPRTSTPGLSFLLYGFAVGGEGFWGRFRTQWLTLAPSWDGAYGLFLKKEAPLVWSYTSSQAYHEEHGDRAGDQRRYRALVFEEGNPVQIEGAAIAKGADPAHLRLAREFLEFLLSGEAQARVPRGNWMLPVMPGVALPPSFRRLPRPLKIVRTATEASEIEARLVRWKREIGGQR